MELEGDSIREYVSNKDFRKFQYNSSLLEEQEGQLLLSSAESAEQTDMDTPANTPHPDRNMVSHQFDAAFI
ncbi:unnamed protein product [Ceratitis capitata]|uniref:(Mediterranean fruit fly) hypothetical protein n=1 Tax=Ceratitis capitata TaxID=7213 RepID=A0A811UHJ0_CERCA|nr:unnamed protein product [Ceratitis capitata]